MIALPARTRRTGLASALVLLAALAAVTAPAPAAAQSKSDAFAGKVPPVAGQLYRKDGRLELTLSGNLSVNDAFWSKYFAGVKLGYHLTEFWSISGQYATGASRPSGSAVTCPSGEGCRDATDQQMWQVPGKVDRIVGLEVAWSPIYGKLNVASERVAHFDVSLLAGGDWITYRTVVSSGEAAQDVIDGTTPGSTSTYGGHVGLGVRLFLTEWMAARLEVKDYIYVVAVPEWKDGQRTGATGATLLQNQIFTELGFSFFLPMQNRSAR
jgi:outer membrane beta-barrel protein